VQHRYTFAGGADWTRIRACLKLREFQQLKEFVHEKYLAHGPVSPRNMMTRSPRVLSFSPQDNWKYMDEEFGSMLSDV
jgi:hypothetical protein